jgi:hypothetical protein
MAARVREPRSSSRSVVDGQLNDLERPTIAVVEEDEEDKEDKTSVWKWIR